jgi:hypothetical protein
MKQIKFLVVIAVIAAMSIASCGRRINRSPAHVPKMIMINPEPHDVYTEESFKNLMKTPDYKPTVVVRNTVPGGSDVSSNSNSTRVVALVESGLTRNKIDVRDRGLFDRVLKSYSDNNQSINYVELSEKTQTDLLFEITDYTIDDYYEVNTYSSGGRKIPFKPYLIPDDSDPKGKRTITVKPSYEFRGMSVEIKVVVLKDNTIGGTYRYFYVPCSEEDGGCEIISFGRYDNRTRQLISLRYRYGNNQPQDIDDITSGNYSGNRNSNRRTTRGERIDQAMANFITDKVIPSMLADMRGEAYYPQESSIPGASRAGTMQGRQNPNLNIDPETMSSELISTQQSRSPSPQQNTPTPSTKVIPSKNSYYTAQSVSSLISQELMEQEAKNKKPKGGKTDEERLRNLQRKALTTVSQFIISSATSVGSVPNDSINSVIIFSEGNSRVRQDFPLLCFVDGKCIGVGSKAKGVFTSFPKDQFELGFHTLSLRTFNNKEYVELFSSKVDFSIKHNFLFDWNGRSIKLAN